MFLRNVRGLVLIASAAAILLAASGAALYFAHPVAAAPSTPAKILRLQIDGEIEPMLAEYIVTALQRGRKHASLMLITMDTPGGLDTSMRRSFRRSSHRPCPSAYVNPTGSRAASAGFFILLSADIAAMSPGTETGAASPISIGGQPVQVDQTLKNKI